MICAPVHAIIHLLTFMDYLSVHSQQGIHLLTLANYFSDLLVRRSDVSFGKYKPVQKMLSLIAYAISKIMAQAALSLADRKYKAGAEMKA